MKFIHSNSHLRLTHQDWSHLTYGMSEKQLTVSRLCLWSSVQIWLWMSISFSNSIRLVILNWLVWKKVLNSDDGLHSRGLLKLLLDGIIWVSCRFAEKKKKRTASTENCFYTFSFLDVSKEYLLTSFEGFDLDSHYILFGNTIAILQCVELAFLTEIRKWEEISCIVTVFFHLGIQHHLRK